MILVIDNYDSFTWNLVDLVKQRYAEVKVLRNDEWPLEKILELQPKGLLISPGPGRPEDSGVSKELVRAWMGKVPVLGVCMGLQVIGTLLGAELVHAMRPMHGKPSPVQHNKHGIFHNLPNPFPAMRYHSLILKKDSLPPELEVTAQTAEGEIMGIQHKMVNLHAVQFHPESILTPDGHQILDNWLDTLSL